MIPKWQWLLNNLVHQLWFRASLFGALAVATALVAIVARDLIPEDFPAKIGAEAVDSILSILASSMLAVTTFSLSVMVVAYGNATTHATPRATRLLVQDSTMQNTLATFIGSFLFALVGIIALSTGVYGGSGRVVLFAVTLFVVLLIVVAIVRWSDYLTRFGRLSETTSRVEEATAKAMQARAKNPNLGGRPLAEGDVPPAAVPVPSVAIGYIENVDVAQLSNWANERGTDLYLAALPGTFVHTGRALLHVDGAIDEAETSELSQAFLIDELRSFEQDPRFGFTVLSEIASRALSPSINDPGTAIDVIGRALRLLLQYREQRQAVGIAEVKYPRVYVPPLSVRELFDDVFTPIARDGDRIVEVQIRLQKALAVLAGTADPAFVESALRHSRLALQRAESALGLEHDRMMLRSVADKVPPHVPGNPTPRPASRA